MQLRVPGFFARRMGKWLLGILAVLLVLAALLAWQVPRLLRDVLTNDVSQMLGRQVQVGDIRFNPFTLTVRARELSLAQPGAAPLFEAVEFEASASWFSLFWLAPVVDSVALREPKFTLVREGQTRFNFSDLVERFAAGPAEPADPEERTGLPRFSLNNLRIDGGVITLDDRVTGRRQVIDDLDVGLPFISTLRYATDIDVLPHLSMRINGSPISLEGTTLPFNEVRSATLNLNFSGLDLARWADAWPLPVPVSLPGALLDSDLQVHFEQPADAAPRLRVTGGMGLRQFDLREADGKKLLSWDALQVERIAAEPLARTVSIGEVRIMGAAADVARDAGGQLNWLRALATQAAASGDAEPEAASSQPAPVQTDAAKTAAAPEAPGADHVLPMPQAAGQESATGAVVSAPGEAQEQAWRIAVDSIKLEAASVRARDQASGWDYPLDGLMLTVEGLALPEQPDRPMQVWLDMDNPLDGSWLRAHTPLALQPLGVDADIRLGRLALAPFAPLVRFLAPVELDAGRLGARARVEVKGTEWLASGVQAELEGLAARDMTQTLPMPFTLGKLALTADRLAMDGQPGNVALQATDLLGNAQLGVQGSVVPQPLAVKADVQLERLALAPFTPLVAKYAPVEIKDGILGVSTHVDLAGVQWSLSNLQASLAGLSASDGSVKPAVPISASTLALTADKVALGAQPTNFTVKADGLQGSAQLGVQGTVVPQPLSVQAKVDLSSFDVVSLAPYFASSLNATLRSAKVGVSGEASFAAADGKKPQQAGWRGDVALTDFDLEDRVNRADFLRWGNLSLQRTQFSMNGEQIGVDLGDVLLDNFYGNVLLNSQGRLNVMDLVAESGQAGGSITQDTQTRGRAPAAAASSSGKGKLDIALSSVKLARGTMTFQDRFVKPNYTAELSSVEGSVSAVSSGKPTPAKVQVGGRVYRTAPFSVSGTVQPFSDFLSLDLRVNAKGVDMPRFTTYSAKYVGYPIKRGKLSLDVRYQIKDRALQASNHVVLNQLTFGDRTDSPDALQLPVMLAVALLTDSQGNIDINLPISGSLDDPQFSIGGIIVRVFVNLITKAVTAPFQLLASAFGGGGDSDLSYVAFEPGSAQLDAEGEESIATLAKALNDRPALKLNIAGRADPAEDEPALRQAWLARRLSEAKAADQSTRSKKIDPATVQVGPDEREKYLEEVYDDTDIKEKPRNFLGLSKSIPAEQMEALLLQAAPVATDALRKLAEARAETVLQALRAQGPADRVSMASPVLGAEGVESGEPTSRVDFSLQ